MAVNKFSDLTYDEIISGFTGLSSNLNVIGRLAASGRQTFGNVYVPKDLGKEPEFIDYREKGAINPIRDQEKCRSCWAFSIVSSIESQIFLQYGQLVQLSEQNLVDCGNAYATSGTEHDTCYYGGWPSINTKYVINHGISYRYKYPYTGKGGTVGDSCNEGVPKTSYRVIGGEDVQSGRDNALLNALVHRGPISVCIYVSEDFPLYDKGVIEDDLCTADKAANHAVVLVGYGNENGKNYWLIRNSWGKNVGDNGYYKLSRNVENHCQISSWGFIPVTGDALICTGGVIIGGQCLVFSQEKRLWVDAKTACESQGQTLASLSDPQAVLDYVKEKYGNEIFFLGGSDAEKEGE
ncbi:unnamed protein product, partial [Meganyctiphanes norvegica]